MENRIPLTTSSRSVEQAYGLSPEQAQGALSESQGLSAPKRVTYARPAGAENGKSKLEAATTPDSSALLTRMVDNSAALRFGLVTAEGAALAVPAFGRAAYHDLSHFQSDMLPKLAGTATFAAGMKLLLPAGIVSRTVGGAMLGWWLARDAIAPMWHAWSDAIHARNSKAVDRAAHQMGNALGSFAWDSAWSLPLCGLAEQGTGAGLKRTLGPERFNAFEGAKSAALLSARNRTLDVVKRLGSNSSPAASDLPAGRLAQSGQPEPTRGANVEPALIDSASVKDSKRYRGDSGIAAILPADGKAIEPFSLVLVGANGDLAKRKVIPALYELYRDGHLPDNFHILGAAPARMSDGQFRDTMKEAMTTLAKDLPFDEESWGRFAQKLHFRDVDITQSDSVRKIKATLKQLDERQGIGNHNIFYLSIQPSLYSPAVDSLAERGLAVGSDAGRGAWPKLVIEKPFGHDLKSSVDLDKQIHRVLSEDQVYRVDHYLGKQTVQNIYAFRFNNGIYEPMWNREFIDHIQITNAETLGVEGRGRYYEEAGAMRDMVQNHLMHVLSLTTMEKPISLDAEAIRAEKTTVLQALRPIDPAHVHQSAVRGQYSSGTIAGKSVPGYRQEPNVAPESKTETFAALKMQIDNERWKGVPIFLRSGKRLARGLTDIAVYFKPPEEQPPLGIVATKDHPELAQEKPRLLVMHIQPEDHISVSLASSKPGENTQVHWHTSDLKPDGTASDTRTPTGYERLILDGILGDPSQFARSDFVNESWKYLEPILDHWQSTEPGHAAATDGIEHQPFPNYKAGSWGPKENGQLIATTGNRWRHDEHATEAVSN